MNALKEKVEAHVQEKCGLRYFEGDNNSFLAGSFVKYHKIHIEHWLEAIEDAYVDNHKHFRVAITSSGELIFDRINSTHDGRGWVYHHKEKGSRVQFDLEIASPKTNTDYEILSEIFVL